MTDTRGGTVEPFTAEELAAIRQWHRPKKYHPKECMQGDAWPCRHARFLATLDAQNNPAKVAAFYAEWSERLVEAVR